jgi:cysteine synthase A
MVRLTRLAPELADVELYAKLEALIPGGSVKDRIGVPMIEAAEREGRIAPGRTTIVEATSGNTGIALAFVCAAKGYDLVLTLPQGMSRERESLLRLYGAEVHVTESLDGMNEAVDAARAMARETTSSCPTSSRTPPTPRSTGAPRRPRSSTRSTGASTCSSRAWAQRGRSPAWGEVLKERNPEARVVAVEPAASAVLSGGTAGPHKIQASGRASGRRCSTST